MHVHPPSLQWLYGEQTYLRSPTLERLPCRDLARENEKSTFKEVVSTMQRPSYSHGTSCETGFVGAMLVSCEGSWGMGT